MEGIINMKYNYQIDGKNVLVCLECGEIFDQNKLIEEDDLGHYLFCKKCGSSSDVTVTDENGNYVQSEHYVRNY
jgi:DNA-directed RNA polymerase subunit RPC12/RpoP